MRPLYKFCAQLMFTIPHASILLFMDLLSSKPDDPRFTPYIEKITDIGTRRFFDTEFYSRAYDETRAQVRTRFSDLLAEPIYSAFSSPSPSLNMLDVLNKGKIVLVNTRLLELGLDASRLIGRYIISLTFSAAMARGRGGRPAFLYIDEFQDYVDPVETARQLRFAREYNLGYICAHQNMFCAELDDDIRTAISTNTAIKYCSRPKGLDTNYMARDFDCDPSWLASCVSNKTHGIFGCSVPGSQPFKQSFPFDKFIPELFMSEDEYQQVLALNERRLHPQQPPNESLKRWVEDARKVLDLNKPASPPPKPGPPKPQSPKPTAPDDEGQEWG
jgi:hypothetical protein